MQQRVYTLHLLSLLSAQHCNIHVSQGTSMLNLIEARSQNCSLLRSKGFLHCILNYFQLIVNDRHLPQWKARPLNTRDFRTCKIRLFSGLRAASPHKTTHLSGYSRQLVSRQAGRASGTPLWPCPGERRLSQVSWKKKGALARHGDGGGGSQQTSMPQNRPPAPPPSRLASTGLPACYSPSRHLSFPPLIVPIANSESYPHWTLLGRKTYYCLIFDFCKRFFYM